MNKKIIVSIAVGFAFLMSSVPVFAHVVVKPSEVGVASFQTFTVGVPNEKESPVIAIRLLIPDTLHDVTPNVKPGWKIDVKKVGESMKGKILNTGKEAPDPDQVTEIIWTAGVIPPGQRDDFNFSIQAPANESTLEWKAYQTYANGEVVAWDQSPQAGEDVDDSKGGPYSTTKVINDLKLSGVTDSTQKDSSKIFSIVAVALSVFSVALQLRKKGK